VSSQALASSVACQLDAGSFCSGVPCSLRAPKSSLLTGLSDQARLICAPVRATQGWQARTPSIGSTSPCGEVDRVDQRIHCSVHGPSTLSQPAATRLVTVMGLHILLLVAS
jgi:hypothetical protein